MPYCARCGSGLQETAEYAFYYCNRVRPFWDHVEEWTVRVKNKQLVLFDVGYVVDKVLPPFQGEKHVVFLAILAVARMVIWMTRKKGLYDDANFSHHLVLYFRHQLRVKIRYDRKCLDCITFDKRWMNVVSLVVRKGATLESSFPLLPAHGVYGPGPSGPCRDLPTDINRSDYSFALEKIYLGTAGKDEALFDPNLPLQLKKG